MISGKTKEKILTNKKYVSCVCLLCGFEDVPERFPLDKPCPSCGGCVGDVAWVKKEKVSDGD